MQRIARVIVKERLILMCCVPKIIHTGRLMKVVLGRYSEWGI
jgi:hypothetical protein